MFNLFKKTVDEVVKDSKLASKAIRDLEMGVDSIISVKSELQVAHRKISEMYDSHINGKDPAISFIQIVHFLATVMIAGFLFYDHVIK